ncbi:MAG: sulfatase-like hydrolase/transferase [Bacteroidetes bacterium]|nr:sulfatase-like hydrolase/transferase [Bacteroidota bacterium]
MKNIPGTLISLPPALLAVAALTGFKDTSPARTNTHPNILLIMVDQMQTPPEGYGSDEGAAQGLKEILGFRSLSPGNLYSKYFPGLLRLRQNAVILKKHYTASSASVPSRCCIMTGQYSTVTGVTQTDGLFKSADNVPFLDSIGIPTIGDWFLAAGYTTHYFGKWHVSEPKPPDYLKPWGFSDWESSYPEPHGGSNKNLGVYRDVVFTDNIVDFLQKKGADTTVSPWFTVASLVNPHDVSSFPINWQVPPDTGGVVPWAGYPPPLLIPAMGDKSTWGAVPTWENGQQVYKIIRVDLNPEGFPQENSSLPPTFTESLDDKPRCQKDYAFKWGLACGANTDYNFISNHLDYRSPLPFQLQGTDYQGWSLRYMQFYFYCQYLAELQIRRILKALDDNDLTDNTIVVFLADHGEMTAAHGGLIQKWHNAYEESVRVPIVISSPLVNSNKDEMREILQPTSSMDLAPTLLGLAGFKTDSLQPKMKNAHGQSTVIPFAGADLSPYIKGTNTGPIIGPDGNPRTGVLFMTNDMITAYEDTNKINQFHLFLHRVDSTINLGYPLVQGPVRQPNNIRAFCTGDWKIVQYVDPQGIEKDEWELYCLANDPIELFNLDDYSTGEVRDGASVPGMTKEQLILKNESLKKQLANATGLAETTLLPKQIQLFQNLPNPFSQQTAISFYIPETGPVHLEVTDLSGRVVQVLMDETLPSGLHKTTFNPGASSPGVYLFRLNFNQQQMVKKMILMK